jgi:phospholipid/cholesterol/gamma-HCH transport system substrate-binding protein
MGPYDPASFICSLMVDTLSGTQIPKECFALAQTLNARKLPMPDQLRRLLGLPAGTAPAATPPAGGSAVTPAVPGVPATGGLLGNDPTLGGILRSRS